MGTSPRSRKRRTSTSGNTSRSLRLKPVETVIRFSTQDGSMSAMAMLRQRSPRTGQESAFWMKELFARWESVCGVLFFQVLPSPFGFQVSAQQADRKEDEVDNDILHGERVSFECKQIEYWHQDQPKDKTVQHLSPDESVSTCRLGQEPRLPLQFCIASGHAGKI
jgi:hypothetical protein